MKNCLGQHSNVVVPRPLYDAEDWIITANIVGSVVAQRAPLPLVRSLTRRRFSPPCPWSALTGPRRFQRAGEWRCKSAWRYVAGWRECRLWLVRRRRSVSLRSLMTANLLHREAQLGEHLLHRNAPVLFEPLFGSGHGALLLLGDRLIVYRRIADRGGLGIGHHLKQLNHGLPGVKPFPCIFSRSYSSCESAIPWWLRSNPTTCNRLLNSGIHSGTFAIR